MKFSVELNSAPKQNTRFSSSLHVCWMVVKLRYKNVPIFVSVGVSHRHTLSTKVYVDREGDAGVEKMDWWCGGDSRVMRLPSKGAVGRWRQVLCDVILQVSPGDVPKSGCAFFLFGHRKNLVFYSSPFLKSDQLWSFFIFSRESHRLVEKLLLISFFLFLMNSINILPCTEIHSFHFGKNLGLGNIRWVLFCPVNWNCHYFVCMINQKRSQSVI